VRRSRFITATRTTAETSNFVARSRTKAPLATTSTGKLSSGRSTTRRFAFLCVFYQSTRVVFLWLHPDSSERLNALLARCCQPANLVRLNRDELSLPLVEMPIRLGNVYRRPTYQCVNYSMRHYNYCKLSSFNRPQWHSLACSSRASAFWFAHVTSSCSKATSSRSLRRVRRSSPRWCVVARWKSKLVTFRVQENHNSPLRWIAIFEQSQSDAETLVTAWKILCPFNFLLC